ncbi:hypothetical protein BaRGS_00034138, partial [Batillaria attramentaria]
SKPKARHPLSQGANIIVIVIESKFWPENAWSMTNPVLSADLSVQLFVQPRLARVLSSAS